MADNGLLRVAKEETFGQFVWNSETKQFFGRTAGSWLKITVFYVIFYLCLAAFFAGMFFVFYQTLDTVNRPKYTPGDGGSILRHPAMGFRPLPRSYNVESTLIWYRDGDRDDISHWENSLNDFTIPYEAFGGSQHIVDCTEDNPPGMWEVCRFEHSWFTGKCRKSESWGYSSQSPCVILKMNRMIDWVPAVYKSLEELPPIMPQSLKDHIAEKTVANGGSMPKMIWVSCQGESAADEENIGKISYSPHQGFPAYYFPFNNTLGYLPPLVAVEFSQPEPNTLINIECRAWARNIIHSRKERLGLVHFEILMD